MPLMTENMNADEIIAFAATRGEIPWQWGCLLKRAETELFAKENGLTLHWEEPIKPGDLYLGKRNQGYKLLTCRQLGDAWVGAEMINGLMPYPYDFSECVKVS